MDGISELEDFGHYNVEDLFRAYTDSLSNLGSSMSPPSIPPPPPPPPPLNIPPSRARLQLAARLAMHQKNNQSAHPLSAALHPNGGEREDEDDDDAMDPFRDGDDDIDDDDDLDADVADAGGRGSWWRSMVGKKTDDADDSDEGDEDGEEEDEEEEEEFGEFAVAEENKSSSGDVMVDNLVLRPLPVNPAKESSRGLSGLWPFGSRSDSKTRREDDKEEAKVDEASTAAEEGTPAGENDKAVEVKEATSRTSIEEPDEDEVEVVGGGV
ncbi:hypothetical protein E4U43_002340 [Claviceps pusilla]|uniref:Uncharacterized protein n=1 Tax=Claviceps pusilla TaxID=123648 RepID=A0A9P7N7P6_9HYPO|nr:hypothetical protein E4U43_002340 [Claviceps pusilla]